MAYLDHIDEEGWMIDNLGDRFGYEAPYDGSRYNTEGDRTSTVDGYGTRVDNLGNPVDD